MRLDIFYRLIENACILGFNSRVTWLQEAVACVYRRVRGWGRAVKDDFQFMTTVNYNVCMGYKGILWR